MILIAHYLGVRSQESGFRSQPTPNPSQEGKEEEGISGESFLFAGAQRTLTLRDRSSAAFCTENVEHGTEFYPALIKT
ncbi:hypothetical protein [Okeania sp. SIO1I7]|uniref:hypothetical protein n=1 Tax=Okeania sp. SIO1I7 TaxID=2607772 RepID=UPI0013FC3EAF|nr:hypothetical protein [Okeania sp. SIO1I7]NET25864.1 hypothetical protein [Okeania sp. SIO1I7]